MSPAASKVTLPLAVQRQQQTEWCWAAVSVSVNLMFRPDSTHTQCELASGVLNQKCCSGDQPAQSSACNTPHELNPVLGRLHLLACDPLIRALTFDELKKEIDGGRPVCVLIKWLDKQGQVGPRGHFIAIDGYRITPAQKQFVSIGDPFYGPSEIDYTEFSNKEGGYRDGRGRWYATFLTKNEAGS